MILLARTNTTNDGFIRLVKQLDADLAARDGAEHSFYSQFNSIESIKHVVLAYDLDKPVGCGALKDFSPGVIEIKRMYTVYNYRNKGIGSQVLKELEKWALEMKYNSCILETGKRQPEAIQLYKKNGYYIVDNYGQYKDVENSVCFRKELDHHFFET